MNLIEDLEWRHACKGMNGRKVPQNIVERILKAVSLAPSSLGMQAYKILVIENEQLKEQIFNEACLQQPIKGCSHLLVFTSYTQITEKYLDDYFRLIKLKRNPDDEWCDNYRKKIESFLERNQNNMEAWLTHQVYIALGIACVAAANEKVDSVPIEGFNKDTLNRILNLPAQGLSTSVLLPLGYRDPEKDWMNNQAKVRKDKEDIFEIIK
ncbi:nitroreductase family protein [Dysgonomonas sp. Marseille-P4677]|uniref:nitroreductase family protein n=1 Tax=Dysgonomonas sp. Marseille-P4677 TaxID=2364790 RepID=UPI0019137323|nr:nitroreductase family protein [Dysgonomonas sp. Marseille-P4677]MBK5720046.1 nitroreductase family protein [Dysgonomonas sp. Marseille-P4677]